MRDLPLLRGQLVERARVAPPSGLTRRRQLYPGLVGPRPRAEPLEHLERRAQLRRAIEALPLVRERVPGLRAVAVAGPRIDPAGLPRVEDLEVVGYVHELYRHLAACDVAVVQGGLTTTMELVAAGRPFVSLPLASHFEQQFHVRHRLGRYGARTSLAFADASAKRLADTIADLIGSSPAYRPIDPGGAARAAELIAELI